MPDIKKIVHIENRGEWAIIHVLLDDGEEAQVWVGGAVEVYYHHGKVKAFVKRNKPIPIP